MKQVFQSLRTGAIEVMDVPSPMPDKGRVLVRVAASLISAGTERMLMNFAGKGLLAKARARPDLAKQLWHKAKREGVLTTIDAARSKLDRPIGLGYSNAGTIVAVGEGIHDLSECDRVACAGGGYATHAEFVSVPRNLVARIEPCCASGPVTRSEVPFEEAAFTTLGSIALHGMRLADAKIGETVAVIGLGILGQIVVQVLKAAGCKVAGMDIQPSRVSLALQLGADAAVGDGAALIFAVDELSHGIGADSVLITADTSGNGPVELAGAVARNRAIVVAVGAVGMQIPRKIYYDKELDFRICRSYGPGRYDPNYEEKGHDYPIGYVRWTENRNMEAFLGLLGDGRIQVRPLITHTYPIADAGRAYDLISGKTSESFLGVVLTFDGSCESSRTVELKPFEHTPFIRPSATASAEASIGVIGAGNFATGVLLPAMKKVKGIEFIAVCAGSGSARHAGDKFGFRYCTTDFERILKDDAVNTVVIATRHNLHARFVTAALEAGKHVFCEKPLALSQAELESVYRAYTAASRVLTVGYNRRFAPMSQRLKAFVEHIAEPVAMHYRVNAGAIPLDHWVQEPDEGGGRVLGEVCHFIDFLMFLAGSQITGIRAQALPNGSRYRNDNIAILLEFASGSAGTIWYVANGDESFSKERVEVFGGGAAAVLDDFRALELRRDGRTNVFRDLLRVDKGHRTQWDQFVTCLRTGTAPIPVQEIFATSTATFDVLDALRTRERMDPRRRMVEAFPQSRRV